MGENAAMSKGRDALRELSAIPPPASPAPQRQLAGAVRAVGVSVDRIAQNTQALRQQLEQGEHIVEIDPKLIDQAFASDRLEADNDPEFEGLKNSIAEHGQHVPILVRPHPELADRYQIAFGRRRTRAVQALGRPVRAIVRRLSDDELVIAQGKENGDRKNLSFIERALFATLLETKGFDRPTVMAALSVDKFEVSRLITVASTISADIIQAIGPAPRAGRPRWLQLAQQIAEKEARARVHALIQTDEFRAMSTNDRFVKVLHAVAPPRRRKALEAVVLRTSDGRELARVETSPSALRIKSRDKRFVAFLGQHLGELVPIYEDQSSPKKS
jgi:ParB family chromosome partitioning protein